MDGGEIGLITSLLAARIWACLSRPDAADLADRLVGGTKALQ